MMMTKAYDRLASEHGRMEAALEAILADPTATTNIILYARVGLGLTVLTEAKAYDRSGDAHRT